MASSLSNLINNLAEEIHRIKCKYEMIMKKMYMIIKNVKDLELNTKTISAFLNTQTLKII